MNKKTFISSNNQPAHLVWREVAPPADRHVLVRPTDHLHTGLLCDSLAERRLLRCEIGDKLKIRFSTLISPPGSRSCKQPATW